MYISVYSDAITSILTIATSVAIYLSQVVCSVVSKTTTSHIAGDYSADKREIAVGERPHLGVVV